MVEALDAGLKHVIDQILQLLSISNNPETSIKPSSTQISTIKQSSGENSNHPTTLSYPGQQNLIENRFTSISPTFIGEISSTKWTSNETLKIPDKSQSSPDLIIGVVVGTVGGILLLATVVGLIIWAVKRRRGKEKVKPTDDSEIGGYEDMKSSGQIQPSSYHIITVNNEKHHYHSANGATDRTDPPGSVIVGNPHYNNNVQCLFKNGIGLPFNSVDSPNLNITSQCRGTIMSNATSRAEKYGDASNKIVTDELCSETAVPPNGSETTLDNQLYRGSGPKNSVKDHELSGPKNDIEYEFSQPVLNDGKVMKKDKDKLSAELGPACDGFVTILIDNQLYKDNV